MKVDTLFDRGHKRKCVCCGSNKNLTFDHIIPISKGGDDLSNNGQVLCVRCNGKKGNSIISLEKLRIKIFGK